MTSEDDIIHKIRVRDPDGYEISEEEFSVEKRVESSSGVISVSNVELFVTRSKAPVNINTGSTKYNYSMQLFSFDFAQICFCGNVDFCVVTTPQTLF